MNNTQKLVLLTRLIGELQARGSWVGETHIQKAVYMLQELTGLRLGYPFVLYKHGPFSLELREELNDMRARGLLDLTPKPAPYGPSYSVTDSGKALEERFPNTLGRHETFVTFVADLVGDRSASELERLGTALLLIVRSKEGSDQELAGELHGIKPHVTELQALDALAEMKRAGSKAPKLKALN